MKRAVPKKNVFGTNLNRILKDKKITQTELARQIHRCQPAVSRWIRGEILPPLSDVIAIQNFLHCSYDSLLLDFDQDNRYTYDDIQYGHYMKFYHDIFPNLTITELPDDYENIANAVLSKISTADKRDFVRMRYGLNYEKEYTYAEIAKEYNVSRQWIQQCVSYVLKRMAMSEKTLLPSKIAS